MPWRTLTGHFIRYTYLFMHNTETVFPGKLFYHVKVTKITFFILDLYLHGAAVTRLTDYLDNYMNVCTGVSNKVASKWKCVEKMEKMVNV